MDSQHKSLPHRNWSRIDTWAFISFAMGMFIESYIFGMSSIATTWVKIPDSYKALLLSWSPLWLIIGIGIAGPVSDRIGRKQVFYITMSLYAIGAIGITFSYTFYLILIFLGILLFASGGEMNTIMALSQEIMPRQHRSSTMLLELNFIPLGGLVLAAVAFSSLYSSIYFQRLMVALTIIIVLVVLVASRRYLPESFLWLASKGKNEQAIADAKKYYGEAGYLERTDNTKDLSDSRDLNKTSHFWLKFFATLTTAFAGTTGFGLIAYELGPIIFPNLTDLILLVSSVAAFAMGLIGFFGEKISRKSMLLWGNLGALAFTIITYELIGTWSKYIILFWALVVILNAFVQLGYLAEDTLKSEVWATKSRGSLTALVRFLGIGLYIPTIYITYTYNIYQYMLFNILVWVIGSAGAVAWYILGKETGKGIPIELAD
ncbi:MFS transporter [Ferroplasma acidiphilum]|uniref:MFS transporter n=1 Tax=Ferroplasma acidiphilum TaxID=74969 RepID=A0A7K4FN40_9ARCH|nr:MFS transporter [Ferroplasma acidiphilum]MCL4349287.1 MFS transporter [Candidatus Thermoplasmatota archaeon]NOL60231.1 MFS transporter [Ferroplasma acidiphilum]